MAAQSCQSIPLGVAAPNKQWACPYQISCVLVVYEGFKSLLIRVSILTVTCTLLGSNKETYIDEHLRVSTTSIVYAAYVHGWIVSPTYTPSSRIIRLMPMLQRVAKELNKMASVQASVQDCDQPGETGLSRYVPLYPNSQICNRTI